MTKRDSDDDPVDPAALHTVNNATLENIPQVSEQYIGQFFVCSRSIISKKKHCKRQLVKAKNTM